MELISRKEAKEQGLKKYFTGEPCVRGHILERLVSGATCRECNRLRCATLKHRLSVKAYVTNNPEKAKSSSRTYRQNNPDKISANIAKRRAYKLQRTPSWADFTEIKKLYTESSRLSKETGIKHHVDHIVPLQGENVCGLHVHYNLQVIPARDNIIKSNTFHV